jgi:hypothetical protein
MIITSKLKVQAISKAACFHGNLEIADVGSVAAIPRTEGALDLLQVGLEAQYSVAQPV